MSDQIPMTKSQIPAGHSLEFGIWNLGFQVLWRLTILVLPWQTRWIFSEGTIGGFSWEQGTVAVYASWGVLLLTIVAGFVTERTRHSKSGTGNSEFGDDTRLKFPVPSSMLLAALVVLLGISILTSSRTATLLWWSHVAILGFFAWTLMRSRVEARSVAFWFALSLVPQAMLGIWQYADQNVAGSTILGIATQQPWVSGVSVVEHGLYRVLRAYGGFPHPNIFGGWLAVGLTLLPALARRSRSNAETLGLAACAALFSLALALTFSRGAWAAAILGLILAAWTSLGLRAPRSQQPASPIDRQAAALVFIAILIATFAGVASELDHVAARFRPGERLERWSLEQRKTALEEGMQVWLRHPIAGWGPGASLVAVSGRSLPRAQPRGSADLSSRQTAAPEPPHAVPLVILVETGALGFVSVLLLVAMTASFVIRRGAFMSALPIFAVLVIIALSDHYLWTLWAGQALAAVCVILVSIDKNKKM